MVKKMTQAASFWARRHDTENLESEKAEPSAGENLVVQGQWSMWAQCWHHCPMEKCCFFSRITQCCSHINYLPNSSKALME